MSTIYKNLTYQELVELAPKDKPFQVRVLGKDNPDLLWANLVQDKPNDVKLLSSKSFIIFFTDLFDLIIDPWDNFSRVHFNEGDILEDTTEEDSPQYKLITKTWDNTRQDDKCFLQSGKENAWIWHKDLLRRFIKIGNPERKKTEYSLKEIASKLNIPVEELRIKE